MKSIVEMADKAGEFITGDDGFVVYWPREQSGGAYSAWQLRELADELDRRNAEWEKQLNEYFDEVKNV